MEANQSGYDGDRCEGQGGKPVIASEFSFGHIVRLLVNF